MWDVSILIASADASSENLKGDYAKILPIDVSGFIEKLPQNKRLKQYTYWRLPAFAEAAQKFDKILYLDTDFHVLGAKVMKLFDIDMKGAPLAAVRDVHQSIRQTGCQMNSKYSIGIMHPTLMPVVVFASSFCSLHTKI